VGEGIRRRTLVARHGPLQGKGQGRGFHFHRSIFPNVARIEQNLSRLHAIIAEGRAGPLDSQRGPPLKARLDAIDWKILKELQGDGRMTNVELSRRVGISAPPCLRRVRALEEAGIIEGYRALVDEKSLGFDVTAFAFVGLNSQAEADLIAFEEKVKGWAIVRESHMLSGEIDFILKCVAPDLRSFQNFVIEDLTTAPNVGSVRTSLAIRRVKNEPMVPVVG
jgi:DNA-binding Lrp family transcriptional regulator